jgi:hypothetical protein
VGLGTSFAPGDAELGARRRALVETALVCADGCGPIWLAFLVLRFRSCTDGDCRKAVA